PGRARSVPRFDGRQLARWHLDPRRVPPDSQILFAAPGLWQTYRWHVVSAVGLIAAQTALIVALLVQRRPRRDAQAALAELLRFEMLVSDVVTACASATADRFDERIRDALRRVVTFLGVDRGALWQRAQDGSALSVTHVWQRPGAAAP